MWHIYINTEECLQDISESNLTLIWEYVSVIGKQFNILSITQ